MKQPEIKELKFQYRKYHAGNAPFPARKKEKIDRINFPSFVYPFFNFISSAYGDDKFRASSPDVSAFTSFIFLLFSVRS